jgi:O-antigen ligase
MTLLFLTATVVSLTRTSILFTGVALVVGVLLAEFQAKRVAGWTRAAGFRRAVPVLGSMTLAMAIGLAVAQIGLGSTPASASTGAELPLDRILFHDVQSNLDSVAGGRFVSYRAAWTIILQAPLLGQGLGKLIPVSYAYSEARAHTIGMQPGVDNALLTIGVKAGLLGVVLFVTLMLAPLLRVLRQRPNFLKAWFVPAWLGVGALLMTKAFAVTSYGPPALILLAALPWLPTRRAHRAPADLD